MKMNVSYTVTGSESSGTQILMVIDGASRTVTESHPNFDRIMDALLSKDFEELPRLVEAQRDVLSRLSEKVTISGSTLYYNGEALYDRLAETVVEFYKNGRNFQKLINFMERLFQNPSRHSRTQLFEFLDRHNFAITDDGHFLAYKGVDPSFFSISSGGEAIVNGEKTSGRLHNAPGNILEMARSEVMDDPSVACSFGLHAGTWEYASSFGPIVVEVKIDPADVVSVPNDSNFQKIRTAKYTVLRQVERPVLAETRYDMTEAFMNWLSTIASAYTRKGRVAPSYEVLVERFIEGLEVEPSEDATDALYSLAYELDSEHEANSVYRYHIEQVLVSYQEAEDEEDEEDEFWNLFDEEEYEEDEEESHYGW
jgi:hypothetical protein